MIANKFVARGKTFVMLICITSSPHVMYSMRQHVYETSERSPQESTPSCLQQLLHILCCFNQPACDNLRDAIIHADLDTVSTYLSPSNANTTFASGENWLTLVIQLQRNPSFIIAFIKLLVATHEFEHSIVEPLLLTNNLNLMRMFINNADLVHIESGTAPLKIYELYHAQRISRQFAIETAYLYNRNGALSIALRDRFALIAQTINYGHIDAVIKSGNRSLIRNILAYYPTIITQHQFYISNIHQPSRPVTPAVYAALLFRQKLLNKGLMYAIVQTCIAQHHESNPTTPISLPNAVDEVYKPISESVDSSIPQLVESAPRAHSIPPPTSRVPLEQDYDNK